ncbi:MAG: hypothetical protein M1831_002796 [Alyxoria varia]|nr:MAG: hypothetical protein M1831_002796 [Alyxoria varia]
MTTAFIPLGPPHRPEMGGSLMNSLDTRGKPVDGMKDNMNLDSSPISPLSASIGSPIDKTSLNGPIDTKSVGENRSFSAASTKLQTLIREKEGLIVCPGVYDGLSARVALQVGFDALYMTGAGTSASRLGVADLGLAQLADMRDHAEMIASLDPDGPPLIADMDTGYGGPMMVAKSVSQYVRAGVAGFHIEDQVQNKRCGHLSGKRVVGREEYYSRIRAAKAAKAKIRSDIVLIARTDALQTRGYDECVERLKVARDLGADVGLLEGFTSKEMAAQAVKDLAPWPLLLNMVENGSTPVITTKEAEEMGFKLMIFSFASVAPAYEAIKATFEKLKHQGVVGTKEDLSPRRLFEVCGLEELMRVDSEAGGSNFQSGV